jgi:hypothetical protein
MMIWTVINNKLNNINNKLKVNKNNLLNKNKFMKI